MEFPEWLGLALTAPFIGSFLGVLAVRLPQGRPVMFGRSRCEACGHSLGARDLVPFFSWALLRGRCRHCGAGMGTFYPLVEVAALAVVLWAATLMDGAALAASCVLGWLLLTLALTDGRDGLLPDALTLPLLLAGLAAAYVFAPADIGAHLIGAVAGFVLLALLAQLYRHLRGREGLGLGDAKLLGALGAWVGWQGLPGLVLIAAVMALVFVLLRSTRQPLRAGDRIVFGPFLALAGWIVWLYGPLTAG